MMAAGPRSGDGLAAAVVGVASAVVEARSGYGVANWGAAFRDGVARVARAAVVMTAASSIPEKEEVVVGDLERDRLVPLASFRV